MLTRRRELRVLERGQKELGHLLSSMRAERVHAYDLNLLIREVRRQLDINILMHIHHCRRVERLRPFQLPDSLQLGDEEVGVLILVLGARVRHLAEDVVEHDAYREIIRIL